MNVNRLFLICSAICIPVIGYSLLHNNGTSDKLSSPKPLSDVKQPIIQTFAAKDGELETDNLKMSIAALEIEVAKLRTEMLTIRASIQSKPLSTTKTPVDPPPFDPSKEVQRQNELRTKEDDALRAQNEQLESSFRQQTQDPEWASKIESSIKHALLNQQVPANNILSLECRVTMCRLELSEESSENKSKMSEFSMLIGDELPNIRVNQVQESDGTTTTVMYLSKDDFTLTENGS